MLTRKKSGPGVKSADKWIAKINKKVIRIPFIAFCVLITNFPKNSKNEDANNKI